MQLEKPSRFSFSISVKKNKLFFSLLISIVLLLASPSVWAGCASNGEITGVNGQTILGSVGCADNGTGIVTVGIPGMPGSIVTAGGIAALIAPVSPGNSPWNITISSNGSISADGAGSIGIQGADVATITNNGTITATGDATSIGIQIQNANAVITNSGSITSDGTAINLQNGGTVNNSNSIDSNDGVAINSTGSALTVLNSGNIVATGMTTSGVGIFSSAANNNITNTTTGFIGVNGLAGGIGISLTGGNSTVINNGGIDINSINGDGIDMAGGNNTVTNSSTGSINAPAFLGGNAITMESGGNNSVTNDGSIFGNVVFSTTGSNTNNTFTMTGGQMSGALIMSGDGLQTANFNNVTDANIGTITQFNGGGGGNDVLNFNNSSHTGGSDLVGWETINLNSGSTLTLSGDLTLSSTTVSSLNINSSTLNANDPTHLNAIISAPGGAAIVTNSGGLINIASPTINNTLTIQGNYSGNSGAQIELNAVLGDDSSPADRFIIDRGNASGSTGLLIHNIGGTGAQTTSNGILVIETVNSGTTDPGAFTLSDPLRAGAFDYRLFRGGLDPSDPTFANDWFLRSTFTATNEPGVLSPILGPELSVYGSVLPTAIDISRVTLGTLNDRVGDETNLLCDNCICNQQFANGGWIRTFAQPYRERYSSIVDPKAKGTVVGAQAGLDVYRNKNARGAINLVGIYGAYSNADPDIDGLVTNEATTADINAHTGSVNLNALTSGAYWTHFWCNGSYLDLVAQATAYRGDADSTRTTLSLHGVGTTESAELGYPFYFTPKIVLEPQGQILYQYARFNDGSDTFSDVDIGSSNAVMGRLGARLKYTTQINCYTVQPYLRANFWSIFSGDHNSVLYSGVQSIGTSARANWAQLGGGVNVNFTRNFALYGFVDGLANLGSNDRSFNGMDAGVGVRAYW